MASPLAMRAATKQLQRHFQSPSRQQFPIRRDLPGRLQRQLPGTGGQIPRLPSGRPIAGGIQGWGGQLAGHNHIGWGQQGGGHGMPNPFRHFQPGGPGGPPIAGQGNAGYHGLGEIIQLLQGGISGDQLQRLSQGYTGANGAIGHMHGAFSGLSPYAVHFLATSGLLQQQQPQLHDVTGLTGDDLALANAQNMLMQQQPSQYKLGANVNQDVLAQLLGQTQGGGYAKGYGAGGPVMPGGMGLGPTPPYRPR